MTPEERSTFFRTQRLNRGLSQAQIADEIGITRRVWQRAEEGFTLSPGNALRIAKYFRRKVTDVWPVDKPEAVPA